MGKKTLYLCGAVTSNPNYIKDFREAKSALDKKYRAINPVLECDVLDLTDWTECMKELIPLLLRSDGVALIPSNLPSRGRDLELQIAEALSIEIHTVDEWLELSYQELRGEL